MIVIGVPTTGAIPTRVVGCIDDLLLNRKEVYPCYIEGSLVYDARAKIVNHALSQGADLLFLDSDIIFPREGFDRLVAHNADIVSGLYYGRHPGSKPIAYKTIKPKTFFHDPVVEPIDVNNLQPYMEIAGAGLGFCLIRHNVLKSLTSLKVNPFEPFGTLGEDYSFFIRAKRKGFKCMLDTTFELKHLGDYEYSAKDYIQEG